jgi:hypothetical protein
MITRRINVFNPGVLTVTQVHAGTAFNVIPEFAEVFGTIRAISEVTRRMIHDGVRRVAEGIAAAHGLEVTVELQDGYDVTVNSQTYAQTAGNIAKEIIGNERFTQSGYGCRRFWLRTEPRSRRHGFLGRNAARSQSGDRCSQSLKQGLLRRRVYEYWYLALQRSCAATFIRRLS